MMLEPSGRPSSDLDKGTEVTGLIIANRESRSKSAKFQSTVGPDFQC